MHIKTKLSTLWVVVMLNLIFADILSIIVQLIDQSALEIMGDDVRLTMAIAAVITNIPILMIYFSRVLPYRINRLLNIIAAILTLIFVIGGGSTLPHYLICAGIEVMLLLFIIYSALQWSSTP
ncbi:hypothetical protein EJ994_04315 [Maribacter sp. MJ134]|uniref:DUF6326 family protein n=1 Tax=Maribacter sp. MJ134 TaxID=2496865 RepID=UPI000F841931|nr:DUF6326 family protein [Maribacter sp. MJ134]AZQ58066.1 hypothetical protein EJ994_04315 [Maribacter sp. MJ134]